MGKCFLAKYDMYVSFNRKYMRCTIQWIFVYVFICENQQIDCLSIYLYKIYVHIFSKRRQEASTLQNINTI